MSEAGRLPNLALANVLRAKLVEYLLALDHSQGGPKAAFFLGHGFTPKRWEDFAAALLAHAAVHAVAKFEASPFGTRYIIEGTMAMPDGRSPNVRAVWFIDSGGGAPRLATAYPLEGEP